MKNTTFVFLLIIANSVVALQWPSSTTSMYILNSQGFKYSNFASLNIEAIHISGDNTNIYSIGEGKISGVNSLMVYKMDHNFNIQWNIWVPGLITHEGSDLSTDESSILLVINSSTQWVVWSIRSLDGNVNFLISIQGVKDCQSLKINGDKAYISGTFSSNSIVIMLNSINLSIVKSYTHTSDNVSFVYPYSISSSNNNYINKLYKNDAKWIHQS